MRVSEAVCVGVQMESGLVGELLTDARWLGRDVGVLLPELDRAFASADGESLMQMRFAVGLDPVFFGGVLLITRFWLARARTFAVSCLSCLSCLAFSVRDCS